MESEAELNREIEEVAEYLHAKREQLLCLRGAGLTTIDVRAKRRVFDETVSNLADFLACGYGKAR